MKIAVNTRLLLADRLDGIAWFAVETLKRITTQNPDCEFHFFFDRKFDKQFLFSENIIPHALFPQARHPFLYYWWFEFSITAKLKKIEPDLFLSPDGFLSLRTKTPSLPVIHDINFKHFPEDFDLLSGNYYNRFFPQFAQAAKRIATVSDYSKNDIVSHYNIASDKIDVVYNGTNENYRILSEEEKELARKKYTKGNPFFIFVSTLIPRKNVVRLMEAYAEFQQQGGEEYLIMVGNKKWWTADMEAALQTVQQIEKVVFTGYVDQQDLYALVGAATALTFVPYFEGFGIPIVEAMQAGTPVLTADASSTAEVAADAALLVDPYDVSAISKAMFQLSNSEELRQNLVGKGLKRAADFTWDRTADLLWNSIQKCLN